MFLGFGNYLKFDKYKTFSDRYRLLYFRSVHAEKKHGWLELLRSCGIGCIKFYWKIGFYGKFYWKIGFYEKFIIKIGIYEKLGLPEHADIEPLKMSNKIWSELILS